MLYTRVRLNNEVLYTRQRALPFLLLVFPPRWRLKCFSSKLLFVEVALGLGLREC